MYNRHPIQKYDPYFFEVNSASRIVTGGQAGNGGVGGNSEEGGFFPGGVEVTVVINLPQ